MRHTSHDETTRGAAMTPPYRPTADRHQRDRSDQDQALSLVLAAGEAQQQLLSFQLPDDHVGHTPCTDSYAPQGIRNPPLAESVSFGPSEAESQSGRGVSLLRSSGTGS